MLGLCDRYHADGDVVASLLHAPGRVCFIVTQEALMVMDLETHMLKVTHPFPFTTSGPNHRAFDVVTQKPIELTGHIVSAHLYLVGELINLVCVMSGGLCFHMEGGSIIHTERLAREAFAGVDLVYGGEPIILVATSDGLLLVHLKTLSILGKLPLPSFRAVPIQLTAMQTRVALIYDDLSCSVLDIVDWNMSTIVGEVRLASLQEESGVITTILQPTLLSLPEYPSYQLLFYLEVRYTTGATSTMPGEVSLTLRGFRLDSQGGTPITMTTLSEFSEVFRQQPYALPTDIVSYFITPTSLITHLVDDSMRYYHLSYDPSHNHLTLVTGQTFQPISRFIRSILRDRKYVQDEVGRILTLSERKGVEVWLGKLQNDLLNRVPILSRTHLGPCTRGDHLLLSVIQGATVFYLPQEYFITRKMIGNRKDNRTASDSPSILVMTTPFQPPNTNFDLKIKVQRGEREKYKELMKEFLLEKSTMEMELKEKEAILERAVEAYQDPILLSNYEDAQRTAATLTLLEAFQTERRILELRAFDHGVAAVMSSICELFHPATVIGTRFIIYPVHKKLFRSYGFTTNPHTLSWGTLLPAWDLRMNQTVAAKHLPATLSGRQFLRVYRQLKHRYILTFVGCGFTGTNSFYVVTEAPPKHRLTALFNKRDQEVQQLFSTEHSIKIFIHSLVKAIAFICSGENRLIHRELRPSQIWIKVNKMGEPMAKVFHIGFMAPLTAKEPVEHNTIWASPEVVCGGVSSNSDVWSIGTITFRLLEAYWLNSRGLDTGELEKLFVPTYEGNAFGQASLCNTNATTIQQMARFCTDKYETNVTGNVAPYRSMDECIEASIRSKVSNTMRPAYLACQNVLPWIQKPQQAGFPIGTCVTVQDVFKEAMNTNACSAEAISFIKACWTFDVDRRSTAMDLLSHSWFTGL
ncbi:Kinase [Giardia muris]|uniref:Kinase n=1 Tax=Giardia muris TaxID=5742 RepID=A0A4Z1SUF3_GIAMU|nr:Kinase [Giardia muris]|eukprot:TNJ29532.1 Kinase [Giardia muris]